MADELKDPYGGPSGFLAFMDSQDYSLQVLQLVNETKGRYYLNSYAYQMAKTADYSHLSPKDLAFWVSRGGFYQHKMHQCGKENLLFPKVGFNRKFIDWLVQLEPEKPRLQYEAAILFVYAGDYALKAMKLSEHPDLVNLIEFAIINTRHSEAYKELWHELHPSIPLPQQDNEWQKIEPMVTTVKRLKHRNDFQETFGSKKDAEQEALATLGDAISKELKERPETVLDVGLKNKLNAYFRVSTTHDLIDKQKHKRLFVQGIPDIKDITRTCAMFRSNLHNLSYEHKRLALESLGIRVYMGETIKLEGVLPIELPLSGCGATHQCLTASLRKV